LRDWSENWRCALYFEDELTLAWEVHRVFHSLCLQQMTTFMAHNDLQASAYSESKSRQKRISAAFRPNDLGRASSWKRLQKRNNDGRV